MSTPGGEDNEALMRESDEEKRWRHQKDPHVGSSGKIERHRCARRSHMRQDHMSFSLHGSLTKRREKEPCAARSQAHMSTSIVSSQIEWLTRWTRRRSYGEEKKGDVVHGILKRWNQFLLYRIEFGSVYATPTNMVCV
jgi:hypothetical protein